MTHFGTLKKLAPGHFLVVHKQATNQHLTGTPCGFCGGGRRSDARGILCSKCSVYAEPQKWAREKLAEAERRAG